MPLRATNSLASRVQTALGPAVRSRPVVSNLGALAQAALAPHPMRVVGDTYVYREFDRARLDRMLPDGTIVDVLPPPAASRPWEFVPIPFSSPSVGGTAAFNVAQGGDLRQLVHFGFPAGYGPYYPLTGYVAESSLVEVSSSLPTGLRLPAPSPPPRPQVRSRFGAQESRPMAVDQATLVQRLDTLCRAACAGDAEAVAKVQQIKTAAAAGDARAKIALAGLRRLFFARSADTASWNGTEAIYRETARGNPKAKAVVTAVIARAQGGDKTAQQTWGRLKAIHGSTQPGALFPSGAGQAKIGGYGMPSRNLPGVVVGGRRLVGAAGGVHAHTLRLLCEDAENGACRVAGEGLPVRAANGMVVGRAPVVVGGPPLSPQQIQELHDLMDRAARARVQAGLQASFAAQFARGGVSLAPKLSEKTIATAFNRFPVLRQTTTVAQDDKIANALHVMNVDSGTDVRGSV